MDQVNKIHILNRCNTSDFTIDDLDRFVKNNQITIEEFVQYNLEISKVNELKKRKAIREGEEIEEEEEDDDHGGDNGDDGDENSKKFNKKEEIQKIINDEILLQDVIDNIDGKNYSYDDLERNGISEEYIDKIRYAANRPFVQFFTIDNLPQMEKNRTDIIFVGNPASGKSTMLAGLLHYSIKKGKLILSAHNNAGNNYQKNLVSDLKKGILPRGTMSGSFNYIATEIKDAENRIHPLNILEVPGENYTKIDTDGFDTDDVKGFVNYIKNDNKKIIIFVLDAEAEESYGADSLDQNLIYTNIFSMFKKHGILDKTDAIYLVINKFDILKRDVFRENSESDPVLAKNYLFDKFNALKENITFARSEINNEFQIKIFPYSIGDLFLGGILNEFEPKYSKFLIEHLLEDSFIIEKNKFAGKF